MNCLKCGREIPETQVFCDDCLQVMESYPVKPGTAVYIPTRPPCKRQSSRKKPPAPAEQIARLKRTRLWLCILAGVLVICLGLSLYAAGHFRQVLLEKDSIGKNYSTAASVAGTH